MKTDREIACDTSVLRMLGADDHESYGHTLIDLAEKISHSPFPFATGMSGSMAQMQRRIINIATYQKESFQKVFPASWPIFSSRLFWQASSLSCPSMPPTAAAMPSRSRAGTSHTSTWMIPLEKTRAVLSCTMPKMTHGRSTIRNAPSHASRLFPPIRYTAPCSGLKPGSSRRNSLCWNGTDNTMPMRHGTATRRCSRPCRIRLHGIFRRSTGRQDSLP